MITHEKPWRYEEDGLTVTRGSAWSGPGCHLGCGVLLYSNKEGELVKVEGDKENPFNQGRLCVRCLALPEVVYSPERLQYPLKRAGERGENKWTRISWDEAYDTIEREFNKVKAEYGAESVIFTQGTGRDIAPYGTRLAWSFGSPNYFFTLSGSACYLPRVVSMGMTSGSLAVVDASQVHETRYDDPNYRVPETLIIWANNPIVSNSDGFYGHWVIDMMKRGTKLIVIDPRRTWLASKSELFLQIRPGTDAALALGMINIIIQEGLYDKEFVDKWTFGFDKFAARAAEYPVDKVSKITWIPEEKIIAAARMFAKSKPGAVQWGLGVDMTRESFPAAHAISALWAICGDIDVPGGMIPPPTMLLYVGGWGQNLLPKEQAAKKIGASQYPLFNMFGLAQTDEMQKTLITGKPYPFKAAWIQTANVMACTGIDPKQWYEGFRKLDFVAVVDLFMTPTAVAFADIVLPACTYAERNGLRFGDGAQRGETINKAITLGECKSDMEINLELGRRFNPEGWPWKDDVELFTGMLAENAPDLNMNFEQLREVAPTYPRFEYKRFEKGMLRADHEIGFNTPTGRVELYSNVFEAIGLDPLPYYEEPSESPLSTPDLYKEYPLVLTTGARPWGMFHSEHRQIPHLRAIHPQPTLQIHPETAAKYGVTNGEWVWVENTLGRIKRQIEVTPIIDPRVVNSDHAWWFPEKEGAEPNLFGVWDVNVNQLVPPVPGRSGMGSNVKSLLCKIYKIAEGE